MGTQHQTIMETLIYGRLKYPHKNWTTFKFNNNNQISNYSVDIKIELISNFGKRLFIRVRLLCE